MRFSAPALPLTGSLPECLDRLNSLPAAHLDALQALLHPVALYGLAVPSLPHLATLPLAAQARLLLLLRAAPHRFSTAQRSALLAGVAQLAAGGCCGSDLLQILAAGEDDLAPVPACPSFLYTPQPCFPWAPVLGDAAAAAALRQQLAAAARQQLEEQAGEGVPASKRHAGDEAQPGSAAKRQRQAGGVVPAGGPQAAAGAELDAAVAIVRQALGKPQAAGTGPALAAIPPELRSALGTLLTHASAGATAGAAALHAAGLDAVTDDALLLLLLQELVSPASSFARCTAAAAGLLLPRLRGLEGAAPRDLAAAAGHVAASNPQAYIAACLRPLLSGLNLNKHQAELLNGSLKAGLPAQLLPEVLTAACAASVPAGGGEGTSALAATQGSTAPGGSGWNEHTVAVLQAVLNAKPVLTSALVAQLAGALLAASSASAELAASPKFAKLALSVVKQYPSEAAEARGQLQALAQACKGFMAKPLAAAVAKL